MGGGEKRGGGGGGAWEERSDRRGRGVWEEGRKGVMGGGRGENG